MSDVDVAVIPAAGLGTRMLPATKTVPKELLTIVDRPAIQRIVEEIAGADIARVVIVTSPDKPAVRAHFEPDPMLEAQLERSGRHAELEAVRAITELADVEFVEQVEPLGLGHAVLCAIPRVGEVPFAVLLPDQLQPEGAGLLRRMIDVAGERAASVVALRQVSPASVSSYGCAAVADSGEGWHVVTEIVEKPDPADAPSALVVKSRYVFTPEIVEHLRQLRPGHGGELQLTDAMQPLAQAGRLLAVVDDSPTHDIGTPAGFAAAQASYT